MRPGGILLFAGSLAFGLGAEYSMGESWLTENSFALMVLGAACGLAWAVYDFWPRTWQFFKGYVWIDLNQAARLFRDWAESGKHHQLQIMFDELAKPNSYTSAGPSYAFKGWLVDGLNRDILDVWGVPKNGFTMIRLRKEKCGEFDSSARISHILGEDNDTHPDEIWTVHGQSYHSLSIRRTSLWSLMRFYENDDAQRRSKAGQN